MLRVILCCCVLTLPAGAGRASGPPLSAASQQTDAPSVEQARSLYNQGYYQSAIDLLQKVRLERPDDPTAVVTLVDCYLMIGRYDDALTLLGETAAEHSPDAGWQEARGSAFVLVGRYAEAVEALNRAVELAPERLSARYALGKLYETLGRKDDAIRVYQRFEDIMHDRLPDDAIALTLLGQGFYRYSVLTRHPNLTQRTKHVLQEVFQHATGRLDPDCWQAYLAAADLLAGKYNTESAQEEYESARKINHNIPTVYVGLGRLALEDWDFDAAERRAQTALGINTQYAPALYLIADLHLTERKYAEAVKASERALAMNPNDLEALSRLAAARWRLGHEQEAEAILSHIQRTNPRGGPYYAVMGEWLSAARQFPEAERFLLAGIEQAPEDANLYAELGLMYMQWGEEAKARARLEQAWAIDPFNRRTYNSLELLDELDKFATHETPHFLVRYSPGIDAVVAPYIGEYMESIYEEVCDDFGHVPDDKTIIEIFPTHRKFAVRITHQPFIHTIGACTGRVIAMDAPRPTTGFGRAFNWAQVLRHEFVHTITLAATRNRIAHWLTEGLAVYQEDAGRPWSWCLLLSRRLRQGSLYSLDALDWGFIRPQRPGDRQLAYAQSEWICEYLVETFGYASILSILDHMRDRVPIEEAIKRVTGQSTAKISEGFRRWAVGQVRSWNLPTDPLPNRLVVKGKLLLGPDDAALHAQLAETLLFDGQIDEARAAARRALELDENERRALAVLCEIADALAERAPDDDDKLVALRAARQHAERLAALEPQNWPALRVLANSAALSGDAPAALQHFEQLKQRYPLDPASYRWLAAHYLEDGQTDAALSDLIDVWRAGMDDAKVAGEIAGIYQRRNDDRQALLWYREAAHVDPYDVGTHERLGQLHLKLNEAEPALRELRILAELEPDRAKRWEELALLYRRLGEHDKAREAARQALRLDANSRVKPLAEGAAATRP